jgi:hypothetical protein
MLLLLSTSLVAQKTSISQPSLPSNKSSNKGAQPKPSPDTLQKPAPPLEFRSAPPKAPDCNCATPSSIQASEPRESFSELTLFLFASALALFVALLGWSDQIRGIDKDTKELEARFLEETGIEKRDFLCVVKPKVPGEQLATLTKLMNSGRIQSKVKVNLLSAFKAWNKEWSRLERLSVRKYYLAVALTMAFFFCGVISLFTHPSSQIRLHFFSVRCEMLVLALPMTLVAILLGIIIDGSRRENALRALLDSIADEV